MAYPDKHIGAVGGHIVTVAASFVRPANTTAYASGQLVANNTVAGSVVPLTFAVAREPDRGFMIRRLRLKKTSLVLTNASFRLHLYRTLPVPTNGDGGVWLTGEKDYLGAIDVTMDKAFTDFAKGFGVPNDGSEINGIPDPGTQNIYGLLEARGAYTPDSGGGFTATLEVHQD